MDNVGMAAALASMTHGDNRYEGTLMLSALPSAPVVSDPPRLAERVRLWRRRRADRLRPAPTPVAPRSRGGDRSTAEACQPCPPLAA